MSKIILILIGVGVVALAIVVLVLLKISNAKKKQKLLENLDKINREKKAQINEEITLQTKSTGENVSKDELFEQVEKPQPEEDINDEGFDEPERHFRRREEPYPRMPERSFANNQNSDIDRDREFQTFLDEHAYSRKIFDKTLLEKIREMPPEMKAIVLGNLFDRFND